MKNKADKSTRIMVLAAGIGTRLRPLTYSVPKPMIPIANRPALEHFFINLREQGFRYFVCNLHTLPEKITDYFGSGEALDISIKYSFEKKLLGNAGGLKKVEKYFCDATFAVISGDGFTNIDLRKVIEFHRKKKAFATMVLKDSDTELPFGFTRLSSGGRIKGFVEKPRISSFISPTANTGIYVFEPEVLDMIPKNTFYDFGKDLWPKLLREGRSIYGFKTDAYWCDIGDLNSYKKTVLDVLKGIVKARLPGKVKGRRIYVGENVKFGKNVKLVPPCIIGGNTRLEAGSIIGPSAAVGKNSILGRGVTVKDSIIWDNVVIDNDIKINNCIISHNAKIKESITLYGGAVISTRDGDKEEK